VNEPLRTKPFLVVAALVALLLGTSCPSNPSHVPGSEAEPVTWILPVATPRVPSEFGALIEGAKDHEDAYTKTQQFLEDTTDPVQVGYLLLYCNWKAGTTHWREPHEADDFGPRDRGEWYFNACGACLDRLTDLGKQGKTEAIRQFVFVLTEVHHDAAFSEEIGQAFCLIGEPAIPFLDQIEGKHAEKAHFLIGMIVNGQTYY